jgi:phage I-like protein
MPRALPLIALLAAHLMVAADGTAQLLPVGEFSARDGRPGNGLVWRLDDAQGQALADRLSAIAALTPIVVDYDHATITTRGTGNTAPAAGWIKAVQWLAGKGLVATVDWTERAKGLISAREYLYISPVLEYDQATGEITGVLMASLVNYPALLGMDEVQAALSGQFGQPSRNPLDRGPAPLEKPMSKMIALSAIATLLGLAETATETDALARVTALQGELDALKARPLLTAALATALGVAPGADEAQALSAVATLKTAAGGAGDALRQIAALQGELQQMRTTQAEAEIVRLAEDAITAGKFENAKRDRLIEMGRKDIAMLKGWIADAPIRPELAGTNLQAQRAAADAAAGGAPQTMSAEARQIAALMGVTPDEYLKFKADQATA